LRIRGRFIEYDTHLFWETVAPKLRGCPALDVEHTKVTPEYVFKNCRIVIVLEDDTIFVPIEVKIQASDQPKQIVDYFTFACTRNRNNHIPVLYLTVDGHNPSDFSKTSIGKDDYVSLSFKDDILVWLEKCEQDKTTETPIPIRENLRQLIATIKSFCGKSEGVEMKEEIFKLIAGNDDLGRAALEIREVADFRERAWDEFKGPITVLVQKVFPDAEYCERKEWYYLNVPIKDGRYRFGVNYLWDKAYVQAANVEDAASGEDKALYEKMSALF
jgi:hypothetical protein